MKNIDPDFLTSLQQAANGAIFPVQFVWFQAKRRDTGDFAEIGIWTYDENVSVSVPSGQSGALVTRSYLGGLNLEVDDIPYVSDLTIQSIDIKISQIAEATQALVREYDIRLANCEIHEMTFNPETGQLSAIPSLAFLGQVDAAPITTPRAGEEGDITVTIVSDAISMLSRTNPRKSSYEGQKRRNNDEWGKYASTVETWTVPWGQD